MIATGHLLEASVCSVKWVRDLCHERNEKLMPNVRMSRNISCVDNLSKKKVSSALSSLDKNLAAALKDEYGEGAKVTWAFLIFFNYHIIQPLLTVSTSKGIKIKEVITFIFSEDIQLKCFRELSDCIINDCHPYVK